MIVEWRGIEVEVTSLRHDYMPSIPREYVYWHIEVRAKQPLPITETGFKSIHWPEYIVSNFDSIEEMILEWLEIESKSPAWRQYEDDSRQSSIF